MSLHNTHSTYYKPYPTIVCRKSLKRISVHKTFFFLKRDTVPGLVQDLSTSTSKVKALSKHSDKRYFIWEKSRVSAEGMNATRNIGCFVSIRRVTASYNKKSRAGSFVWAKISVYGARKSRKTRVKSNANRKERFGSESGRGRADSLFSRSVGSWHPH